VLALITSTTRFMVRPNSGARFAHQLGRDQAALGLLPHLRGPEQLRAAGHELRQFAPDDFSKEANFRDTAPHGGIRDYEHRELAPQNIRLGFAVTAEPVTHPRHRDTQMQSLFGRCWESIWSRAARPLAALRLYAVIPCALDLFNFAAMGWFGIPLGVATSMFAAMTLATAWFCHSCAGRIHRRP
jgi:hypothetical protein